MKATNLPTRLVWETADEINMALAQRLREIRRRKSVSQQRLSVISGVSLGSIKRFEQSGQISLSSLTNIAIALGCQGEIKELFTQVPYRNLSEVLNEKR